MSLCINPDCDRAKKQIDQRQELFCSSCGSSLLLNNIYRVLRYLGSGGFGSAYLVDDGKTRKVLKILHNTHPKAVSLFDQEADVLQKLHHSGIPRVDEGGRFDYFPKRSTKPLRCLAMEYIEGDNLADYLAKQDFQPISEPVAIDWLHELVEILDLVHGAKYFHRDIKPSNIMIRNTGKLALIDFGTAREETQTYLEKQKRQNVTGIVSSGYTPHEQANGRAEYRSDFFALGRTFVFLLTGKEPDEFEETLTKGLLWQQKAQGYSPALRDLIDYLMRPEVTDRPSNTQEILQKIAVFAKIKKKTANILTTSKLHKFLSENKAIKDSLVCFRYKDNTVKVEVKSSDFSIAETFDLEEGQTAVSGAVFVQCEEIAKILPALSKSKTEICFQLVDKIFSLTPDVSVPTEKIIPNRDRAPENTLIIKDHELLRWFAKESITTGKNQTPPAPYIDGWITEHGCSLYAINGLTALEYSYPITELLEWGSTRPVKWTDQRFCIPAIVVGKLNPELPIEIHTGSSMAIKSGNTAITIERLKDPLFAHLTDKFYDKMGEIHIEFLDSATPAEPTRMEKLVDWAKQTQTTLGELLLSPSGLWIGPKGFVKKGFETNPKASNSKIKWYKQRQKNIPV
jgi:serine/threonine protein kinase